MKLLAALTALIATLFVATSSAAAMSSDPLLFEGADGNQIVDALGATDWQTIGAAAGPVSHVSDGTGPSDDVFANNNFENSPEDWSIGPGTADSKADILNFWADSHPPMATASQSPSAFLYLAFERAPGNTNSNAAMEFEINQSTQTWTNPAGSVIPCRTNGDLLISYNVSPSGPGLSTATLVAYQWNATGGPAACPGGEGSWTKPSSPGITNEFEGGMYFGGPTSNCLGTADCTTTPMGTSLEAGAFGEAAVDLNGAMTAAGWQFGTCVEFVQVQVRSRSSGSSLGSALVDSVAPIQLSDPLNGCAAPPPGQVDPTIASVTAAGTGTDGQVHVEWTPAYPGNGATLQGYTITVKDPNNNPVGSPISLGPTVSDTTVNGLSNGTQYTFTVTATNDQGHTASKSGTGTPYGKPGPPPGVTATAGDGSATITWDPAYDNGSPITGYIITSSDGQTITVGPNTDQVTFTGLTNGQPYTFTVSATNAAGTGPGTVTDTVIPGNGSNGSGDNGNGDNGNGGDNGNEVGPSGSPPAGGPEQHILGDFTGVPEDCVTKPFKVRVNNAKGFTKFVAYIDGKKVLTRRKSPLSAEQAIRIDPRKLSAGRHKVKLKLTGKGKKPKTRTFKFRKCSTACVRGKKLSLGHLPRPAGSTLASATIKVTGKRAVKLGATKANGRVSVRIPTKGRFRIVIKVTTTDGTVRTYKRKYSVCGRKKTRHPHRR